MHLLKTAGLTLVLAFPAMPLTAVEAPTGPVIEHYGPVFDTSTASFKLDPSIRYRAVMDVSDSPTDAAGLNRSIESAARYLNMHVRDGVPLSNLELAVVLHGAAGKDALSDQAYATRFDTSNPNTGLIKALSLAGVKIYLCGQTAGYRGYGIEELNPAVTMATSAMTVLSRLQVEGWSLLP